MIIKDASKSPGKIQYPGFKTQNWKLFGKLFSNNIDYYAKPSPPNSVMHNNESKS